MPKPPSTPTTTSGKTEKGEKSDKAGDAQKANKEKAEKAPKTDKADKGEKDAKAEKGEKAGKAEEAGSGQPAGGTSGTGTGTSGGQPVTGGGQPGGGAATPDEQREGLDRQLQTSMAEFDGLLLKEQQQLEEKQRRDPLPERGQGSGGTAAGGSEGEGDGEGEGSEGQKGGKPPAGRAGARGDNRTTAEKQADAEANEAEARAGQPAGDGKPDTGTGGSHAGRSDGGTPVTAPTEGAGAGVGTDRNEVPVDVGDGKNDDVVARQIREAAMKEKDPAIREKLWQEYRDYKKSAGQH